jgi:hypothetical protein
VIGIHLLSLVATGDLSWIFQVQHSLLFEAKSITTPLDHGLAVSRYLGVENS